MQQYDRIAVPAGIGLDAQEVEALPTGAPQSVQALQPREVVAISPVLAELARIDEVGPEIPAVSRRLLRPASASEPVAQVGDRLLAHPDLVGLRRVHRGGSRPSSR